MRRKDGLSKYSEPGQLEVWVFWIEAIQRVGREGDTRRMTESGQQKSESFKCILES